MTSTPVVTLFLRHRADVLLLKRSADVGSYAGQWGAVAGHVEDNDPEASALQEIEEETGLSEADVDLARRGEPFEVVDDDRETRWVVHPYLFDAATRSVVLNWETEQAEWTLPTAVLRRDTVPNLWASYMRVAPSADTIAADTTHGSAYLSMRALEVLRDRAARLAVDEQPPAKAQEVLAETATTLLDAQPSMTALATRIHRVMHAQAPDFAPAAVEQEAHAAIARAATADAEAAARAAEQIAGCLVLTLSRSSTVLDAIRQADPPPSVVVAASRPLGEGVGVAETLQDAGLDVTLVPDAAVAAVLSDESFGAVLVGADTVLPDGGIVNKVGTRAAAVEAQFEDVSVYAVCAVDKIAVEEVVPDEHVARSDVYAGDAPLSVDTRLFDTTPPSAITSICTDEASYTPANIRSVAEQLRSLRGWQDMA
jgi:translation initiation factor 2B subunit (eIF-2B alpha/beta/delta family)